MISIIHRLAALYVWALLTIGAAIGAVLMLARLLANPQATKPALISLTRVLNAGLGGNPNESTSSRVGRLGPAWARHFINLLAWDSMHCQKAAIAEAGFLWVVKQSKQEGLLK